MKNRRKKIKPRAALAWALSVCLLLTALTACGQRRADDVIANRGEIVAAIRSGLRGYSRRITVRFTAGADVLDALPDYAEAWVEDALAETDDPAGGDYIRYQLGGYELACSSEAWGGRYSYTVSVVPKYYMYLYQEELVTEKLDEVFAGFGFDGTETDYEKLRTIYDYVCGHVKYDLIHRKNPYYTLRSTAYAGLIHGTATCQGYCVTLYRMLRTAGIDCRIITGTGVGGERAEYHAWLIAALDGVYYALDPTWDAEREEYAWFLRGSADFPNHLPGEAFLTEEFIARYPMAETGYIF